MTDFDLEIDLTCPKYKLDYSKKITSADIDRSIIEKKYLLWDYVVAHNLLAEPVRESGESVTRLNKRRKLFQQAYALLEDKTIHLYATAKFNGKPVKLYYYQDVIINDNHDRVDVESSNQIGKSFELCCDARTTFLQDHGKNWIGGLISKSMPQNMNNMRLIKQLLSSSIVTFDSGLQENMTVITRNVYETKEDGTKTDKVLYTNTLVCAVATTSALGFPFDDEWLDEFEFWENPEGLGYMYDQVMEPRTFATKGRIRINSNPNGKNFVSEDLQNRKMADGSKQFHVYNFNFLDRPGNTLAEFEQMKRSKHPIIFASTIAALRTEGEGAALTDADVKLTRDEELSRQGEYAGKDKECVFFLDLGFVNDQSVLTGAYLSRNEKGESQVNGFYQLFYPQMYAHTKIWGKEPGEYPSVPEVLNKFRHGGALPVFGLDITGKEGNEIHASDMGIPVTPVKMTGPWKATWYDRFISLVKQGRFKQSNTDNWIDGQNKNFDYQARTLRISTKMSDGRSRPYPLYHHQNEKDHDDVCFVAGTLIQTDKGNVLIETIRVGDKIRTRKGYRSCNWVYKRKAPVISKLGLTGTANHPFITPIGIKQFKYLDVSTPLYVWNEKQSRIEKKTITDTLHQLEDIYAYTFGIMENGKSRQSLSTEQFGKITLVQYLQSMSYITKMEINSTMMCQTLNASHKRFILQGTLALKERKEIRNGLQKLDLLQKNGMLLKKDLSGTNKTHLNQFLSTKKKYVKNALKNILPKFMGQGFVRKFADSSNGTEIVYNLSVEGEHEYFANNILVHNCDSFVGLISLIDVEMGDTPGAMFFAHDKTVPTIPVDDKGKPLYVLTDTDMKEIQEVARMKQNSIKESFDPTSMERQIW